MRKNFPVKPLRYPQSVLIIAAYDEAGVPNAYWTLGEKDGNAFSDGEKLK